MKGLTWPALKSGKEDRQEVICDYSLFIFKILRKLLREISDMLYSNINLDSRMGTLVLSNPIFSIIFMNKF